MPEDASLVPLDRSVHGHKTWKRFTSYQFAEADHWVPIAAEELERVAVSLPILFRRSVQGWQVGVLLGLEPGRNLCVDELGRWRSRYIPAAFRSQPFAVSLSDPEVLCVDERSEWLLDGQAGEPLFDDQGHPASLVDQAHEFLKAYAAGCRRLGAMATLLNQAGVLRPFSSPLLVDLPDLYGIDEARWYERLHSPLITRVARGVMPLVYAQLMSRVNLERLGRYRQGVKVARSSAEPANATLDALRHAMATEHDSAWLSSTTSSHGG